MRRPPLEWGRRMVSPVTAFLELDEAGQFEDLKIIHDSLDGRFSLGLGVEKSFELEDIVFAVDEELELVRGKQLARVRILRPLVLRPTYVPPRMVARRC